MKNWSQGSGEFSIAFRLGRGAGFVALFVAPFAALFVVVTQSNDRSSGGLSVQRVHLFRVNAQVFNRGFNFAEIEFAVFGQLVQRRDRNALGIDFEVSS